MRGLPRPPHGAASRAACSGSAGHGPPIPELPPWFCHPRFCSRNSRNGAGRGLRGKPAFGKQHQHQALSASCAGSEYKGPPQWLPQRETPSTGVTHVPPAPPAQARGRCATCSASGLGWLRAGRYGRVRVTCARACVLACVARHRPRFPSRGTRAGGAWLLKGWSARRSEAPGPGKPDGASG